MKMMMNIYINRYDQFRMKFDPVYKQSHGGAAGGDSVNIVWPDDTTNFTAAAADEDDDLYS